MSGATVPQFGVLLAPTASAVDLARAAERLGYDVVLVADRPGDPDLDPWTLLSWIAAVTGRVGLGPAGLAVAPGAAAVTARAVASLDHLTGGRVELDLGPADADVTAEAVGVVRALWDTGGRGPARVAGRVHRLAGAQRAAPAHDVPIGVTGTGDALLRLAGRVADGWTADLRDTGPDGLAAALGAVDAAARAAGRDPGEVRRRVVVPAAARELLPLVTEHGIGSVVVAAGSVDELTRFAADVVTPLRATLPAATGPRPRRAAVRARRHPGIDYDGVPDVAEVVEPGDVGYARYRSGYLRGGSPGLVLRAATPAQVAAAVAFARRHPRLPLSVRSAGHGISGRSTNDGGIVLDVSAMDAIEVLDERTRRVRVGPGARWADVAAALAPYGWALSSGDYGGVGVGGLATAGGIGLLVRSHGLTVDHLRAVEMVLADGSVVRASDAENPDLFWAVRGAGANFGVVTAFEFEVDEVGPVGFAVLVQDAGDVARYLVDWGALVESAPRDLTSFLVLAPPQPGRPAIAQSYTVVESADPDTVLARLQPLADLAPLYGQQAQILPYAAVMANASEAEHQARGEPVARSGLLRHLTPDFAAAAARVLRGGAVGWFQLRSVGGAVADVDPDATAYPHRAANFSLVVMGADDAAVDAAWARLEPHLDGLYLSFDSRLPAPVTEAWPPATLARLRDLKAKYDPDVVFRDNFPLTPERSPR